jgi:ribosomal protein S4|tara:strand:- start:3282 stop:3971 length:690 start_codon:yes stop_codon:yes gene_type:complete
MRLQKKYKKFAQLSSLPSLLPSRISNFKKSKWKRLKRSVFIQSKSSKKLNNPFIHQVSSRHVEKISTHYKQGLNLKNLVTLSFDNAVNVPFLKQEALFNSKTSMKESLLNCFIKPLFRVDVLLKELNFFKSSFHARQYINEGKIRINKKRVKGNYFLKKGDIISFKSEDFDMFFHFLSNKTNSDFYSFVEFDSYLKTIIITKDLQTFSNQDINLMLQNFFDINKLKDYL